MRSDHRTARRRDHGPRHVIRRARERWGIALERADVRALEVLVRGAKNARFEGYFFSGLSKGARPAGLGKPAFVGGAGGEPPGAQLLEVQGPDRQLWAVRWAGAWREIVVDGRGRARTVGWSTWPLELALGADAEERPRGAGSGG